MRSAQGFLARARRIADAVTAGAATAPHDPNRCGDSYAVTLITPIEPGKTDDLARVLRGFGTRERSPLAKLPGVHCARWVIIDHLHTDWPGAPKTLPRLRSDYLLFSADLMSSASRARELPEAFFRDLLTHIRDEVGAVWSHCRGFPGATRSDACVSYLAASRIDMGLYYAAYPDATVDQIRHALWVRGKLGEFVLEHQCAGAAAAELKHDYLEASKSWLRSS